MDSFIFIINLFFKILKFNDKISICIDVILDLSPKIFYINFLTTFCNKTVAQNLQTRRYIWYIHWLALVSKVTNEGWQYFLFLSRSEIKKYQKSYQFGQLHKNWCEKKLKLEFRMMKYWIKNSFDMFMKQNCIIYNVFL